MSNSKKNTKIVVLILIVFLVAILIAGFFLLGILLTLKFVSGGNNPFPFGKQPTTTVESSEEQASSETDLTKKDPKESDYAPSSESETLRDAVSSDKALSGQTWVCNDGSVLTFEGNDFSWILDPEDPKDSYYTGRSALYRGEDAEILLLTEYKNFDITEAELSSAFTTWPKENLRVLVLNTTEARVDGKSLGEFTTVYYGFFDEAKDDRMILINMNEALQLTFEKNAS